MPPSETRPNGFDGDTRGGEVQLLAVMRSEEAKVRHGI